MISTEKKTTQAASGSKPPKPPNTKKTESGNQPSTPSIEARVTPFPWRAFIVGLVILPICIFWIEFDEIVTRGPDLVAMAPILAVIIFLLIVVGINKIIKRFAPKAAFNQGELLMIYGINSTAIPLSGLGMMQFLVNQLAGASNYNTPTNHWDRWHHYLRPWAYASPTGDVIKAFYAGHSNFFTSEHIAGWITPILVWSVFILVVLLFTYSMAVLLRRQWVESERLQFPIVLIPLELTANGGDSPIWRDRLFWSGVFFASLVELLASLHYTYNPAVPYIPIKPNEANFDLAKLFTNPPLSAIGYMPVSFYPFIIGLGFLLSLEVSFSTWFFYMFTKFELVMATSLGFRDSNAGAASARIPYLPQQATGGFTALALVSIFYAWPHIKRAFTYAFIKNKKNMVANYDDRNEPMSYQAAFVCLVASFVALVIFGIALGIAPEIAVVFVVVYLLWAVAMTRIRTEAGIPWFGGPPDNIHGNIVNFVGSENVAPQTLAGMATLRWIDADYRNMSMPVQLESMKLANSTTSEGGKLNPRHLTIGVFVGAIVSIVTVWLCCLSVYYHYGASSAVVEPWRTNQGQEGFTQIQVWVTTRLPPDSSAIQWAIAGAVMTLFLSVMRTRFLWWPFHPIGYVISTTFIDWIWCPIFVGWACKKLILKYGGMKVYRTVVPFFMGLVIGDFAISAILAVITSMLKITGYRTFPI